MLKVHVKYHLKPGTQADFLAGVTEKTLQDAVLNEDGCLKYEYIPAEGVPDLVLLEEEWTSLQAQQTHLKQPHMARIAELKDRYMDHTARWWTWTWRRSDPLRLKQAANRP